MDLICQCCGTDRVELREKTGLNKCTQCGYRWQAETPGYKYDQKYFEFGYSGAPLAAMSWVRLATVFPLLKTFGRVLDIGCGEGVFVRTARQAGFDAVGYDIHDIDLGDQIPRATDLSGSWDVVTLFDSFEHLPNFDAIFKIDTRFFVVTVPHLDGLMNDDEIVEWKHYKPDEHLHYFTPTAMAELFARHGWAVVSYANTEDVIRKPNGDQPNTMTYVFKRQSN